MMKTGLVRYDAMCHAIDTCHRVDEAKNIRDKALALEKVAKVAQNFEAEQKAAEIRLRAERKAGQLLIEMKEKGERRDPGEGRPKKVSHDATHTIPDLGITRQQSSEWQRLAQIPQKKFDSAIQDNTSTRGLIREFSPRSDFVPKGGGPDLPKQPGWDTPFDPPEAKPAYVLLTGLDDFMEGRYGNRHIDALPNDIFMEVLMKLQKVTAKFLEAQKRRSRRSVRVVEGEKS